MRALFAFVCIVFAGLSDARAQQQVSLELILAIDVSESVNPMEYRLQARGLMRAFRDPEVVAAIHSVGGIAVTIVQWGNARQQDITVPWTFINDAGTAAQVANRIARSGRAFVGKGTAIADALGFAGKQFGRGSYVGARRVIDVSGDGPENRAGDLWAIRDQLVDQGVTINGLAILNEEAHLDLYYTKNMIGGPDAFVQPAAQYRDFGDAMIAKLLREIGEPVMSNAAPNSSVPQG